MHLADFFDFAGLIVVVACVPLTVYMGIRRHRSRMSSSGTRFPNRIETMGELALPAACFGGTVMIQFGNIAYHLDERTLPHNVPLSLASTAGCVLIFGVLLGRVLMRWQLRQLNTTIDGLSGEIAPRD